MEIQTQTISTSKVVQSLMAYASIVFGILTQAFSGIHLPVLASAILGGFGILLHPQTSITSAPTNPATGSTTAGTTAYVAPVVKAP